MRAVDQKQWGVVNTAGVRNVIARLLGVRGPQIPNDLHRNLQLIHDVSRRDPELLFELGIIPWIASNTVAAVAAQNSFVHVTPNLGFLTIITRAELEATAATITVLEAAAAGVPRVVLSSDMRFGGNAAGVTLTQGVPIISDGATGAGVPPTGRIWKRASPLVFEIPMVIGNAERFPLHDVSFFVNTVNIGLDWSLTGYSVRLTPV